MKRTISMIIAIIFLIAFAGCGHEHEWSSNILIEPTCMHTGLIEYSCKKCDAKYTETISELGHNWDDSKIIKEATFYEEGVKIFTCLRCNETKNEIINKLDVLLPELPLCPHQFRIDKIEYNDSHTWVSVTGQVVAVNMKGDCSVGTCRIIAEDGTLLGSVAMGILSVRTGDITRKGFLVSTKSLYGRIKIEII